MLNIQYYINYIILPLIIEKFYIYKYQNLPKIQTIKFINDFHSLKSLDDLMVLRFVEFLEILTNQQITLKKVKNYYKNKKKVSNCFFLINIRNNNMFKFLNYLIQNNLSNRLSGYSRIVYKISENGNIIILFKNIDLFKNMPENLSVLKFNLIIEIIIKNSNREITKYIINKIKL